MPLAVMRKICGRHGAQPGLRRTRLDVLDSVFFGFDLKVRTWYDVRVICLNVG